MNQPVISLIPPPQRGAFRSLVIPGFEEELLSPNTDLFVAEDGGIPLGALLALSENDVYELFSLFVAEEQRGTGLSGLLLDRARERSLELGCGTMAAVYYVKPEEADGLHRLFLRQGFAEPRRGQSVCTIPFSDLARTRIPSLPAIGSTEGHLFPLRALPSQARENYLSRLGREIPEQLDLSQAPGPAVSDLCLAYVDRGTVLSFLTFADLGDTLHLHSAYVDKPAHGAALIALLREAYRRLRAKQNSYDYFSVTVANESAERLLAKLFGDVPMERTTAYYALCSVAEPSMQELNGFGGVLVRANSLTESLAEAGIGSSLVFTSGQLPLLRLQEGGDTVLLSYDTDDPDGYSSFTLLAQALLPASPAGAERVAAVMEDEPGPALVTAAEGGLELAGLHLEEAAFHGELTVNEFVVPFLDQLRRCRSLLESPDAP